MKMFLAFAIGYLLGSIQTAYFVGKFFAKIDVRDYGSRNAGASNVVAVIGWKPGVITAIADVLKAFVAVLIIRNFISADINYLYLAGAGAFIGHCFPFYLRFRGGKGTACMVGLLLSIHWQSGLVLLILSILVAVMTDYEYCGTLTLVGGALAWNAFINPFSIAFYTVIALNLISLYLHRGNIIRLLAGKEFKISQNIHRKNKE